MSPRLCSFVTVLLILVLLPAAPLGASPTTGRASGPAPSPQSAGLMFIQNDGQWAGGPRFRLLAGAAAGTWLAEDAIWLTVVESRPEDPRSRIDAVNARRQPGDEARRAVAVKLSFAGANPHPRLEPFDPLPTTVSYFLGSDPDAWRPDVPAWGGVRYVDLYPGVDLELSGQAGRLVPRLAVRAGADLGGVRLGIEGAQAVTVAGDALRLSTAAGDVTWPLLRAGAASAVAAVHAGGPEKFVVSAPFAGAGASPAGGRSPAPDDNPLDLLYSTYLGGADYDQGYGIGLDGAGAAYIAGKTTSTDFPTTPGAFDETKSGWEDVFIVKLLAGSSTLEYATFLGGNGTDIGWGIALDADGAAYITGSTKSDDLPVTPGAFDTSLNGYTDAFVAKLGPDGSTLEYGTYLGGSGGYGLSSGGAIAVDGEGAAYVAGSTSCPDWPTTPGAFDITYNGGSDGFVAKLSADGSSLAYSTFLGGSSDDLGLGIALRSGSAYVTGATSSPDFPATPGAFDTTPSADGSQDAFVAALSADGSALDYATYLGGNGGDCGNAIVVDTSGAAYVTGYGASEFPTTPGAFDTTFNGGGSDAFVAKLHAGGAALDYGTFLGGNAVEEGHGLALDGTGAAYITGLTASYNFPVTADAFQASFGGYGNYDAFVSRLSPAGSALGYSTFLGSPYDEGGWSIAVDASKAAYVTGYANSSAFPVTDDAFDRSWNGWLDAFMTRLGMGIRHSFVISGRVTDGSGQGLWRVAINAGAAGSTFTDSNGDYTISHVVTGTYTLTPAKESYTFSPPTRDATVPPDAPGQDFVGTWHAPTYSISGRVTDDAGLGIPGVSIDARLGYTHTYTTTSASGDYVIAGLPPHLWGYEVKASKAGYHFLPVQRWIHIPPGAAGQDFSTYLDIGFRPNPQGYSFSNGGSAWGHFPPTVLFTTEDQIRMFGKDAVCYWLAGVRCAIKPSARAWQDSANRLLNGGHCVGMTVTSLRFFKGLDDPADFQAGATHAFDLGLASVREHIAYYHVMQLVVRWYDTNALNAVNWLGTYMKDGGADPPMLGVSSCSSMGGHAVTPYSIRAREDGGYSIKVYDNNWPDNLDRHVEVSATGTFTYEWRPGFTWTCSMLAVAPISLFAQEPWCPFCSASRAPAEEAPQGQVWLTGPGHLLITDAQGRRIGYDGAEFVNEVPGAYETNAYGGLGIAMEPLYTLPLTQTYSILLDGQTLTQTETVDLAQFGPGYAVSAEGVALQPGSQDTLVVAGDGTSLDYHAGQARQADLELALDGEAESYGLQVAGADIGAGQAVTLSADVTQGQLAFNNAGADGGVYELRVSRVSDAGTRRFAHGAIVISATDTHYADYGGWDGSGAITLAIDEGSDGDIDETLTLENQLTRVYLPLIVRRW